MSLSKKQAEYRASLIQQYSINYHLHLILYPTFFIGVSQCQFILLKQCDKLFIDCSAKKINKFVINGQTVVNYKHQGSFLYLDNTKLKIGTNRLLVKFENIYSSDQRGLISFLDVDKKQYIYSAFQSYFAHRVFAIFDQPDLKSPMTLSVICPISWTKILSNEHPIFNQQFQMEKYLATTPTYHKQLLSQNIKIALEENQNKNLRMALFPKTKILPTYIYCVLAGPFQQIQLKQLYNNIPMSLYCSTSYLPYLQKMAPYLFQTTVQCMRFFQKFFGLPYNFAKYDQAFVHQMQSCAMQNNAMVTYHDAQYIWRDDNTLEKALDLADTMAHQLAHHWFGNLTTIKWWDDLWLKQSFAQFFGYYVFEVIQKQLKVVKFQSSMGQFLVKKSQRGYVQDKAFTTHPIRSIVLSTGVGQSIYDGITYVKGAAVLKQLVFLMGDQNFSKALKSYFTKYAYKNTTLDEFMDCLQQYFQNDYGLTLHEWKHLWLQTSSLNELQPIWWKSQHSENKQQHLLTIIQRPYSEKYPILRPHKIKIALFKSDCSYDVIQVFIPATQQINIPFDPQIARKYQAILLNYQDHVFAKIIFDTKSQQFFIKNILKIKDVLTRTFIWRNFYDMVVDADISSIKYLDLFVANIGDQISDTIVQRHYQVAIKSIQLYTPQQYRSQLCTKLFYFTLSLLQKTAPTNTNRLITLRYNLCKLAQTNLSIHILYKWYQQQYPSLQPYKISNSDTWHIIHKIFALTDIPNIKKLQLLQQYCKIDKSQAANLQKIKCLASICSQQQFQEFYQVLLDPNSNMTVNTKKYLIQGLTSGNNTQKLAKYKKRYFADVQKCCEILQPEHVRHFVINFQPTDDNLHETINGYKSIKINDQRLSKVNYKIGKLIDSLEKRLKAYQKFMHDL